MRKLTPILLGLFIAFNAHAAHRTFVAASGTDAGACGPTAPCRTLDYAMSQTDSGGEVIITESGGYGSSPSGGITITKSISIIAQPGIFAALSPTASYNGVEIATAGIKVVLRGLNINNRGGNRGIIMTNGTSLLVEKSSISGFTPGTGIYVQTAATVNVVDTVIRDNFFGIWAGAGATVSVSGSKLLNNESDGVRLSTSATTTGSTTTFNISDTVVTGSGWCVDNYEKSGNSGVINAVRVTATQCGIGFYVGNPGSNMTTVSDSIASNNENGFYTGTITSTLIVSGSTASNNSSYGFRHINGSFISLGNNSVHGNGTDVIGTITSAPLR